MFRRNIALPIGNSESDSIGQFVVWKLIAGGKTGTSRLSSTRPWVKTLRRKVAYQKIGHQKVGNV
ncbi:MAG: hypothetical protein LBG58_03795 [Planctomycetaceae bacterium]|jgi:hypothetical protein|nr:hypothetical protein [Planctomycetaceae bacterium]